MSKTTFRLWSIRSIKCFGKAETYFCINDLSTVTICEKFTTEVLSNFDVPFSRRKLPGAFSRSRFDVIGAHITVLMELRFIVSLCIINTGRDFAGSEPRAFGKSAHNISPLIITTQPFQEYQAGIAKGLHQVLTEFRRKHHYEAVRLGSEFPHNSNHEANQVKKGLCFHHEYLIQHFAYLKGTAIEGTCQLFAKGGNSIGGGK